MSAAARFGAVVAGLVGVLVGAASLVREIVLAADGSVGWAMPGWWGRLTGAEAGSVIWVAAAAVIAVAAALLILTVRQLGVLDRGPGLVEYAAESGRARIDVPALERAMARRLAAELPGMKARTVGLDKGAAGWRVRVEADLPARDLVGTQRRAFSVLAADLEAMGTLRLTRVDVVATHLGDPPAGGK